MCLSHGIHLAILELMYSNELEVDVSNPCDVEDSEEEAELDFDEICQINDIDPSELGEFNDTINIRPIEVHGPTTFALTESFNIKAIVEKVRQIIVLFRKSPTTMVDIFGERSMQVFGGDYVLCLDDKTRWQSTYNMLQRFLDAQKCIALSLEDVQSELTVSKAEWTIISTICKTLEAAREAIQILSKRDTNLYDADIVLGNLLQSIPTNNGLGKQMFSVLTRRINERRGTPSIALQYLHNRGEHDLHPELAGVESVDKHVLTRFLYEIWARSVYHVGHPEEDIEILTSVEGSGIKEEPDFEAIYNREKKLLERAGMDNLPKPIDEDLMECLKEEMRVNQRKGKRGKILQYCYGSLLGMAPTSVERNISVTGRAVSELQTRLSDKSLKDLTMLKSFFTKDRQGK